MDIAGILLNTVGIIFAFGTVIFVHEFGHFIVAKKSGVKVERFSFGLGPEMVGFQWGETRYCIAWLPLGGEVRMAGEFLDEDEKIPTQEEKEPTAPVDRSREFFAQPWYRRIAIAFAGPFMNYVLALVIFFSILLIWGEPIQTNKTQIGEVVAGMSADKAGLLKGDSVLEIQGEKVEDFSTLAKKIHARPNTETELLILRQNEEIRIKVMPANESGKGMIGIKPAEPILIRKDVSLLQAGKKSVLQCWNISYFTVYYLFQKIVEREKPDVAGPLGIGQVIIKAVKAGAEDFFYLIALLSVAIGLFNLFPVPLLDGGHVL